MKKYGELEYAQVESPNQNSTIKYGNWRRNKQKIVCLNCYEADHSAMNYYELAVSKSKIVTTENGGYCDVVNVRSSEKNCIIRIYFIQGIYLFQLFNIRLK